jgi:hypothetical protein
MIPTKTDLLTLAYFDLDGLGTETWLVPASLYEATMAAFEWSDEDTEDPNFRDHQSPLDRAARVAGSCPVISAHWGESDLPESENDLPAFLARVIESERGDVERLVRERMEDKWAELKEDE